MGWFGYGLYDGDGTMSTQIFVLEKAKITDDKYQDMRVIRLDDDAKEKLKRALPKLITNSYFRIRNVLRFSEYDDDYAINAQMLADLLMNNKLPIPKTYKEYVLTANEWLMGFHSSMFDEPTRRRATLRQFGKKLKAYRRSK